MKLTLGIVLLCTQDGVIVKVLHNDFDLLETDIIGKPFPMLVSSSSFSKALSFLVEIRAKQTIFDWELDLVINTKTLLAHCAGLMIEDRLLIFAAQTRYAVHYLFEEMMSINNDQANLLRTVTKEQIATIRRESEPEIGLYEQLSGLNNELVTLQREMAKKNAELERLYAEVQRLSILDELTSLYNRRGFFQLACREIEKIKRFPRPLTAIMLDIDHFKKVNDGYGHAIGDVVLAEVAARCSSQLRNADIFGRYGGEEFAALLPETDIADVLITAERLRHHVCCEPIATERGLLSVTISLGVAAFKNHNSTLEQLLDEADQALYQAKAAGRNCVCVHERSA